MCEPNPLQQGWPGFWHGATRPSLTALLIVISSNIVLFVVLCFTITPRFMAGSKHYYFMSDEDDSYTHVTSKALAIEHSDVPDVVILGSSLTMRCAVSDKLAGLIAAKTGWTPLVYDMTTGDQNSWEMAALVDRLPPRFEGVLVLGVSYGLLAKGVKEGGYSLADLLEHPRLGFTSEAFDNEARIAGLKLPYRTGVYAIDNWRFLLARRYNIVRNLITGSSDARYAYETSARKPSRKFRGSSQ